MDTKNKNHFHIKKIGIIDGITAWIVNGGRIRKELNENFVQSGSHSRFAFIPTDEFWIDADTDFREHRFFLDRFFAEQTLMKSGTQPKKAEKIAATLEQHTGLPDLLHKENIPQIIRSYIFPYLACIDNRNKSRFFGDHNNKCV